MKYKVKEAPGHTHELHAVLYTVAKGKGGVVETLISDVTRE